MMKNLLLIICFLSFYTSFSQYIKVTPDGLKSINDSSFNTLEFPDKSAKELYDLSILFVNEKFKNPSAVIKSDIESKKVRFIESEFMKVSNGGVKVPVDIIFENDLSFKDGKVKYEIINLDMGYLTFTGNVWKSYPIWNEKNGKLRLEQEKSELENVFNSIIQEYVKFINNNNDDW